MNKLENLKQEILDKVKEYHNLKFGDKKEFIEGKTYVNYGGRFFDEKEMVNLVDSSLDFWLTSGPWVKEFETKMAEYLGIKFCSLTNSGSSANLLAFMALTSQDLEKEELKEEMK